MRDIWIRKSWLRLATGLIALAIIAAIWINYRWGLSRDAPPPPTREGKSGWIVPAGGVAGPDKRDHVRIDASKQVDLATAVAEDHQRARSAGPAPE